MKKVKSHFVFNRSERNGIFLLVVLILLAQVGYFLFKSSQGNTASPEQLEEVRLFQQQIDSLKRMAAKDTVRSFSFNPNFISDYKGYTLGMSVEEIDRLHAYRAQDKWVNSVQDFQEVTGVSDSLLERISPLFKFPEWVGRSTSENRKSSFTSEKFTVKDLNQATAEDLKGIYGIGEVLSARIVNYRTSIGGFMDESQLYDVYGLDSTVVERTMKRFKVSDRERPEKKDLNSIDLLDLSEVPGFDYELAREVLRYRELKEKIYSFEELSNIKGFPIEKIERFKLYLTID